MISDPPSTKYAKRIQERLNMRRLIYEGTGGITTDIHHHKLFATNHEIYSAVQEFLVNAGPNIVLDITSLPKRYFFPFLKLIINDPRIENLIVTYAIPKSYTTEALSENYDEWLPLPLFGGDPEQQPALLIASVGFMTGGLPDVIEKTGGDLDIKLLFPFPPGPPPFRRDWEFVRKLEKNIGRDKVEIKSVDMKDVSDAFDHLLSFTDNGRVNAIFAPYGPKPLSLSMCIFAIMKDCPVYYTQPRVYHPDYSTGTLTVGGSAQIYAYCIRLNNHNYYNLPQTQ